MMIARALSLAAMALLCVAASAPARAAGEGERRCLTAAETREALAEHKLAAPVAAMATAAHHAHAEPLRSRLCRWNNEYIYEITLLRRDGKVMRVFVRGSDGLVMGTPT